MTELPEKLAIALESSIDAINDNTHVDLYLLRQTQSIKPEKKFELKTMDIVDDIPKKFREIVRKKLTGANIAISNGTRQVKTFYDLSHKKKDVTFLTADQVHFFPYIKAAMKEHTNLHAIDDLSEVKNFHSIGLRFCTARGDVVYFRKIRSYQLVSRHYSVTGSLHKGKFNKVKDDILAFDEAMDCVYFEEANAILVLDKGMTESIFAFKDFYTTSTKNAFDSLEASKLAEVDKKFLLKLLDSRSVTRQITSMFKENKFNRPTAWFTAHMKLFQSDQSKYKQQLASYVLGDDGRVIISNEAQLNTFLGVCNDGYVRSRVSNKDYFAPLKEELGL